ncbi:hypothetical protein PG990_012595 [Apiospora arundinis]|uniref:Uncharacterized protein n=1 Tax=Apiospora arundinis TaxID=335852 RepID=A0ABR2HR55_9PEZI
MHPIVDLGGPDQSLWHAEPQAVVARAKHGDQADGSTAPILVGAPKPSPEISPPLTRTEATGHNHGPGNPYRHHVAATTSAPFSSKADGIPSTFVIDMYALNGSSLP